MPFKKQVIGHGHIEVMRSAFKIVCDKLGLNCDIDDPMTEIVVSRIVALYQSGHLDDPEALSQQVLADIADWKPKS